MTTPSKQPNHLLLFALITAFFLFDTTAQSNTIQWGVREQNEIDFVDFTALSDSTFFSHTTKGGLYLHRLKNKKVYSYPSAIGHARAAYGFDPVVIDGVPFLLVQETKKGVRRVQLDERKKEDLKSTGSFITLLTEPANKSDEIKYDIRDAGNYLFLTKRSSEGLFTIHVFEKKTYTLKYTDTLQRVDDDPSLYPVHITYNEDGSIRVIFEGESTGDSVIMVATITEKGTVFSKAFEVNKIKIETLHWVRTKNNEYIQLFGYNGTGQKIPGKFINLSFKNNTLSLASKTEIAEEDMLEDFTAAQIAELEASEKKSVPKEFAPSYFSSYGLPLKNGATLSVFYGACNDMTYFSENNYYITLTDANGLLKWVKFIRHDLFFRAGHFAYTDQDDQLHLFFNEMRTLYDENGGYIPHSEIKKQRNPGNQITNILCTTELIMGTGGDYTRNRLGADDDKFMLIPSKTILLGKKILVYGESRWDHQFGVIPDVVSMAATLNF